MMSTDHEQGSENSAAVASAPRWSDRLGLATVAGCLIIAATAWYLLKEFAPLLRPLILAVFLCYMIFPSHRRLTKHIPAAASVAVLAGISVGMLVLLSWLILGSAAKLSDDMPILIKRAEEIIRDVEGYF